MAISLLCQLLRWLWAMPGWLRRRPLTINPTARILIIKPCCMGDVVYTTPVIAALAEAFPQAHIDYAVSQWARPVVATNPRLNQIVDTGVSGSNFSLRQYFEFVQKVWRGKYDVAVVLDRSPLLALLPWLAGIKIRAGIDSRGRGFALNIRTRLEIDSPTRHEAEIYLDVARAIGLNPAKPATEFFPGDAAISSLATKIAQSELDLSQKLAIIHPGGGHNPDTQVLSKRWPAERFGAIAVRLLAEGWQVAIIGAEDDKPLAKIIQDSTVGQPSVAGQNRIFNLAGQLNLGESGALIKHAQLYLGNDTGFTQLAAACGAVTIAIFGPSNPIAYKPYGAKGFAVAPPGAAQRQHLPLAEYQALAAAEGGIEAVTVEQVWQTIQHYNHQSPIF